MKDVAIGLSVAGEPDSVSPGVRQRNEPVVVAALVESVFLRIAFPAL